MLVTAAKERITGTPIEELARRGLRAIRPVPVSVVAAKSALYDAQTVEIVRRVVGPTDAVIDIGANRGALLKEFIRVAPSAMHVAVEPLPRHAKSLSRRFPKATVHQIALSDERGTARFRQVIGAPEHSSLDGIGHDADGKKVTYFDVELRTLDDIAPETTRFVKIDAEFAEYRILRGAPQLLARKPYLAFELGANYDEIWELLTAAGYGLYRLADWLDGRDPAPSMESLRDDVPGEFFFLAAPLG